jgi:cellulose synthase/poly-beta-1,6-N-acetylglucosamine synthase-like glycosyltransferase
VIEILRETMISVGAGAMAVTLPGVIELLLITTGAMKRSPSTTAAECKDYSLAIIVPAHNEEALIGRCVASLLASAEKQTGCRVIVVADNCTDRTANLAQDAGARVLIREDAVSRGKGFALRFAFDHLMAEGFDAFLIVDADSVVSANLVPEISAGLLAGADAIQARYRVAQPLDSRRKRLMDVALLAFNVLRPKGRSGWGLSAGILGNGFALSRQTLLAVPYSAESIVEDLEYHLLLVNNRRKVRFANAASVFGDMPDDADAQESQRARWEGGRARVALAWIPKLAARMAAGNLQVIEPFLELLTLPVAYLAVISLLLCVLPVGAFRWYGAAVVSLLLLHVSCAVALGGNVRESIAALATAPAYVIWKLTHMGSVVEAARPRAQWQRTARPGEVKPEAPHV